MKVHNVKYEDSKVKGILVSYEPGGKEYTFRTTIKNIHVDDLVVVSTDTRWGFTICKVIEVDVPFKKNIDYKDIVRVV